MNIVALMAAFMFQIKLLPTSDAQNSSTSTNLYVLYFDRVQLILSARAQELLPKLVKYSGPVAVGNTIFYYESTCHVLKSVIYIQLLCSQNVFP